jgi:RimJ/RimL family protein N-acetyltransferase
MIETKRLTLKPLTYDELIKHVKSPKELVRDLGLNPSESLPDPEAREAILQDLLPNLSNKTKDPLFCTMWVIIEKKLNIIIGGFCFHGEPDKNGEVEIGYGIDEAFRGKGYMTEALNGTLKWMSSNEKIKIVRAETDPGNKASLAVLEKNNFRIYHENGESVYLKLDIF